MEVMAGKGSGAARLHPRPTTRGTAALASAIWAGGWSGSPVRPASPSPNPTSAGSCCSSIPNRVPSRPAAQWALQQWQRYGSPLCPRSVSAWPVERSNPPATP